MSAPIITNKIGVIVDSFQVGVKEGLVKAKQVGADGVQIYAVKGNLILLIFHLLLERNGRLILNH